MKMIAHWKKVIIRGGEVSFYRWLSFVFLYTIEIFFSVCFWFGFEFWSYSLFSPLSSLETMMEHQKKYRNGEQQSQETAASDRSDDCYTNTSSSEEEKDSTPNMSVKKTTLQLYWDPEPTAVEETPKPLSPIQQQMSNVGKRRLRLSVMPPRFEIYEVLDSQGGWENSNPAIHDESNMIHDEQRKKPTLE